MLPQDKTTLVTSVSAPTPARDTHPTDGAAIIASLTRVLAEWTAPEFLTAVAAREGVDLDPGAITMVTILSKNGPLRPSRLATNMVTGASNISKILARLTKAGLTRQTTDPTDARALKVELTPAGHQVAAAFVRAGNGLIDELLDGWPKKERAEFAHLLAKFEHSTITLSARMANEP